MRFSYHTEHYVPHPVERVFQFFANPDNLPLLMPAWQHPRIDAASILSPPPQLSSASDAATKAAGPGSQITLSFRPFPYSPFRLHWQAEISEFIWNEHFCDLQISGPFAYWNHCHFIRRVNRQGIDATLIADDVEYEIPFGFAGKIVHRLFLRRQIERIFSFRQGQLAHLLALWSAPQPPQAK